MKLVVAFMVMGLVACAANVGTSGATYVPRDSAATCGGYCHEIGLELSSVVIMANNVGCVCSAPIPPTAAPPGAPPAATPPTAGSTSAAAGMAALVVAEEARRQQQQQQQQQQRH